ALHRLAVSPRGDAVVFELTRHTAQPLVPPYPLPLPDGFYFVRADGTGLRRLGPPSKVADYLIFPIYTSFRISTDVLVDLHVSPDGRRVAYTDLGPGTNGAAAPQVFVMRLDGTTAATQVTRENGSAVPPFFRPATRAGAFLDARTLAYSTFDPATGEAVFT